MRELEENFRPWTGPYKVVAKLSETVYRLQHVQCHRKRPVVHFNRLKPCSPDTRFSPVSRPRPQRGHIVTHPPVGSGLELVDDSEPTVAVRVPPQLPPETGPPADQPATPTPGVSPECHDDPNQAPTPPTRDTPPVSPRQSGHRYPKRNRPPPIRLYGTIDGTHV